MSMEIVSLANIHKWGYIAKMEIDGYCKANIPPISSVDIEKESLSIIKDYLTNLIL
jgi:hypothetical protein